MNSRAGPPAQQLKKKKKKRILGLGCSSVVEDFPSMFESLGSIPSTTPPPPTPHLYPEWVSNGWWSGLQGVNLMKAWHIQAWSTKYQVLPWTINIHFKKWRAGGKNRSFLGVGTMGGMGTQGKEEWGWIWWVYFIPIYANKRIKPVEIVLRRGK
jgi:hypothetical protein